jgi:tRNA (guanine37-N1)-methyltransferase
MSWRATVLTLFPDMFPGPLGLSLAGKAKEAGAFSLDTVDPRGFATDKHRSVDDTPFGGGPGMVLRPDILLAAIQSVDDGRPKLLMTPRGTPITQERVRSLASGPGAILVCGRFEGVDERVISVAGLEEVSVGDVVLSGGEPAALLILDACIRLLPGTMGHEHSGSDESFEQNLLEYPQFTKPQEWQGQTVPDVLLSGDHKAIAAWRRLKAIQTTRARRPDLFAKYVTARASGVDKPPKTE